MVSDRRSSTLGGGTLLRAFAGVLAVVACYGAVWWMLPPGYYLFAIFATYALLASLLVAQLLRTMFMRTWRRRLVAVLTVPAATGLLFAGLRPRPDCLDTLGCGRGLTVQPMWFGVFVVVTTALVVADARWAVDG